jgi:hypothetical protein
MSRKSKADVRYLEGTPPPVTDEILRKHGVKIKPFAPRPQSWHDEKRKSSALLPADIARKRARRCITVPGHTMTLARKLGDGNASRGIELALEYWNEHRPTKGKKNDE